MQITINNVIETIFEFANNDIVTMVYGAAAFIGLCVIGMIRQSLKNATHRVYCR